MANNFDSNFTRKLARVFLPAFEQNRVVTKTVNTQLLSNKFDPSEIGKAALSKLETNLYAKTFSKGNFL